MATVPSPVVEKTGVKEKGDRLLAAAAQFSAELELLGVSAAVVTIDRERQSETSCTLGFMGINGVNVESGEELMRQFMAFRRSPMAQVMYNHVVTNGSGEIQ